MYPGRVIRMFSLNESVRGGSREGSSGTSWLEQPFSWDVFPPPLLAHCVLWDKVSHLKTLCASVPGLYQGVTLGLPGARWGSLPTGRARRRKAYVPHARRCWQKRGLVGFPKPFPAPLVLRGAAVQVLGVQGRTGKLNLHIV